MAHQFEIRALSEDGSIVDITPCTDVEDLKRGIRFMGQRVSLGEQEVYGIEKWAIWRMDTEPPRLFDRAEAEEFAKPVMEEDPDFLGWGRYQSFGLELPS